MKAAWLGGSGLLFENEKIRIFVDPSFSEKIGGKTRRLPIDAKYSGYAPSLIIVTHAHPESLDLPTLDTLLSHADGAVTILTSESAYNIIAERYPEHNPVL